MIVAQFLEHWSITENPFRGEEARADSVFERMASGGTGAPPGVEGAGAEGAIALVAHSDFEKVAGDPAHPSTAIIFGEKGSGKTAMRFQIERRLAAYNAGHAAERALLIAYDDLNPTLDRFHARFAGSGRGAPKTPDEIVGRFRQVDHLDAILLLVVPRLVDALLGRPAGSAIELPGDARRIVRRLDPRLRRDALLLQAIYDRPDGAPERTRQLARRLRARGRRTSPGWLALAWLGWLLPAGVVAAFGYLARWEYHVAWPAGFGLGLLVWMVGLGKVLVWDRVVVRRMARRVRRQIRVSVRSDASYARSIARLDRRDRDAGALPLTDGDEPRYAMVQRLRRVLAPLGYRGLIVVVDRVDEPTLVGGDPQRMRAIVWPMLNNKFLQQEGVGFKLLLPIELRHALFKESSAFFQEARLDKQNLIERLAWTGATLHDLCEARLRACRPPGAGPIALLDLFAEDVTRQDLVDALDQMHQPRDAFKLLYHCLSEHCAGSPAEQPAWRIPRHVLEMVKRQQVERVQQLYRGIRPA